MSVASQIDMTLGERQVLRVLTTVQYLAEMGPKSPPPGHVIHSVQSIMRPLKQAEISFMPHAVLGIALLFDRVLQLKWSYYVLIYRCYP